MGSHGRFMEATDTDEWDTDEWVAPPESLAELLDGMTDEEIEILWRYAGFPEEHAPTRARYPRRAQRERLVLAYTVPITREARRESARLFASLAPRQRVVAVVALAWVRLGRGSGPARPKGRQEDRPRERAGHGGVPPMRGSPLGWLASLALPGAPPALIRP